MPTVFDAAAYLLAKCGKMTTMKLQKLVYYSQAWSLVWDESKLFNEPIEAWANGPVCPDLYQAHQGMFDISPGDLEQGDPAALNQNQANTVDAVIDYYGPRSSHWLSQLTHEERPWKEARNGLKAGERGTAEIQVAAMAYYYGSL